MAKARSAANMARKRREKRPECPVFNQTKGEPEVEVEPYPHVFHQPRELMSPGAGMSEAPRAGGIARRLNERCAMSMPQLHSSSRLTFFPLAASPGNHMAAD
jgi:hypothetical protein